MVPLSGVMYVLILSAMGGGKHLPGRVHLVDTWGGQREQHQASDAARRMSSGPGSSGKPWPRLMALLSRASCDIASKMVTGRSAKTLFMDVIFRKVLGSDQPPVLEGIPAAFQPIMPPARCLS